MTLTFRRTLNPTFRLGLLLLCLVVYMCVCAVVFSTLEKHNDHEQFLYYHDLKLNYKQKYNMSEEEFIQIARDASVLYKRGYVGEYMDYWNFYHSFWFTTTVVTTMGFGHVVPLTFEGRIFCIFCAFLGIPLNAVVLKTVGERINRCICNSLKYIEVRFTGRRDPTHVGIKGTIVSFALMVIVLLVGGALGTIFDGWTFFDGVYFNFIALSTIGFGDLFPRVETATKLDQLGFGESEKRFFASFVMLSFMIVGLAVVSTVICSLLNTFEEMSQVPGTTSRSWFDHKGSVELKSITPKKTENRDTTTNQINEASDQG